MLIRVNGFINVFFLKSGKRGNTFSPPLNKKERLKNRQKLIIKFKKLFLIVLLIIFAINIFRVESSLK